MAVSDEGSRFFARLADPMARMMEPPKYEPVGVSEARVVAVHDDGKIDVEYKGAVLTVPATTACDGVAEDDTALLTRYGAKMYATGVLSTGNPHYVKTLWSGSGWYMNEGQTAEFSEPMSEQEHGIIFHWQGYTPGTGTQNFDHNYFFVPKTHAENDPGQGVQMLMASGSGFVRKYLYVSDKQATGHAINDDSSASWGGVSLVNNRIVLVEVLGI